MQFSKRYTDYELFIMSETTMYWIWHLRLLPEETEEVESDENGKWDIFLKSWHLSKKKPVKELVLV